MLAGEKWGWARMMGGLLDSKAPPADIEHKDTIASEEIDRFGAVKSNKPLRDIGKILRPRREAKGFPAELYAEEVELGLLLRGFPEELYAPRS